MKPRAYFVLGSLITGIVILAVFIFITGRSASAGSFMNFTFSQPAENSGNGNTTVLARRLISVPFGIQDNLTLTNNGKSVTVQGHGICPTGGKNFQVDVTVSQDVDKVSGVLPGTGQNYLLEVVDGPVNTNGSAVGHTEGQCVSGGKAQWQAEVKITGSQTFTSGVALACGHAVVQVQNGDDFIDDWCKDVILQ